MFLENSLKAVLKIAIILLFIGDFASANIDAAEAISDKRILLLFSYHPTFITTDNLLSGVRSVLEPYELTLDIEYMDSKRHSGQKYIDKFYSLLKEKLTRRDPYDVILVSDDNALNFVLSYQKELFEQIPVVFMAVNDIELAKLMDANLYVTGIVEAVSLKETIQLAERLHPGLESITFVVDDTRSGRADIMTVEKLEPKFPELKFKFLRLGEYSWKESSEELRNLPINSVLLRLAAFKDRNDVVLSSEETISLFVQNSPVPLYVLREHDVQNGAFGGDVVSFREQGRRAALIVERILRGEPISDIKVIQNSPNQYVFNYSSLINFGVDVSSLPPGSNIVNRPVTIYEQYGQYVWAVMTAIAVLMIFILFLLFEVRARRNAEKALKQHQDHLEDMVKSRTAEIAAANKDLESFSYSVSHDLRAPLRSIDGFSQILIEDYQGKLDSEGLLHLDTIRQAAQRMAQLIDDILELSRVTRRQLHIENVDLSKIAEDLCDRLKPIYSGREINITIENEMELRGDKHLVEIAMQNLIDNAFKYTSKKQSAIIKIGSEIIDGQRTFYVADNGIGFNMKYYNKLFRAFQRLHTIEEFPGTGIGLASVFRVLERHGGRVWAESEEHTGSTFRFSLPER